MRAGKKSEAEIGKTRSCLVYVKNIKEPEYTDLINLAASIKQSKTVRTVGSKHHTRRTQTEKEPEQLDIEKLRTTRNTRHSTTTGDVEALPKQRPTAAADVTPRATRARIVKGEASTVPKAAVKTTASASATATATPQVVKTVAKPLNKRQGTSQILPEGRTCTPLSKRQDSARHIESEAKSKMYRQSKLASTPVVTPPPTIAASRSRRSIKPNPKYASDDMVTPKYVPALASDSLNKRPVKHLFADDDDDDEEELHNFIEEDNDDELNDAAFNPQLHKSDDDDDMSEADFEQQPRREKVPPKRGRGRPPKSASAAISNAVSQSGRGASQSGRGGLTNLQQLRRTIAIAPSLARPHMKVVSTPTVGNKRKLEDSLDTPIARKRMATEVGSVGRSAPVINGSTSVAKTSAIGLSGSQVKPKVVVGSSSNNSGMRMVQATGVKQRPASNFKVNTPGVAGRSAAGGTPVRSVGRPPGSTNALKMQKAAAAAAAAAASAQAAKAAESEDVPTFTIVNIGDIINQDDVLITRSSSGSKKLSPASRGNNNSRSNQSSSSPTSVTAIGGSRNSSSSSGNMSSSSAGNKRLKTTSGTAASANSASGATAKSTLNSSKQTSLVVSVGQTKPRPRILNAEMGKKTQPMMKPLMSMGKELCPMTDGGDTEDEDISNEPADDDITISAPSENQSRVVGRMQTSKWFPNRRNVLLTSTPVNASSNNQRPNQHQQQHGQQLRAGSDRKLAKLLGESSDDDVFKKPASPSTSTPLQRRYKENAAAAAAAAEEEAATASSTAAVEPETEGKQPKYFPPETTTYCEEDGRYVKKITCYETWHVISTPKESSSKTRQQRTCLELPLVKLANVASRIKVPSNKWTSKVTLYKLSPSLMQRQTMTKFTGDLNIYNIPEEERHKYQPSCVLFRRSVLDRSKCRVPFDRALIFKNKCFYANIEGKHVNLLGAPEVVNSVKDVEILIDIVDSLALSSDLVEMVTSK